MARTATKGKGKVKKVMHEFKEGKLKSSSGKKVTSRKQAVAVAQDVSTSQRRPGIAVPFGYSSTNQSQPEAILVDFDFGRQGYDRVISRADDDVKTKPLSDTAAHEVLLINPDGLVKLADFGIAKAAEDSRITQIGSVLGTAAYLSPERAKGHEAT